MNEVVRVQDDELPPELDGRAGRGGAAADDTGEGGESGKGGGGTSDLHANAIGRD